MNKGKYVVFCTVPKGDTGEKIAKSLVEKRLAACVNIIDKIRSIYLWQGKIEDDTESLLIIKTDSKKFEELKKAIKEIHPYTVPEIIALPIVEGIDLYLNWIDEVLFEKK